MSWFDTSNIVSLAKSTLKEAQKTIDKALDITDEDSVNDELKKATDAAGAKVVSEPSTPFPSNSIWGSFTGSFFEATSPDSSTGNTSESSDTSSVNKQPVITTSLQESFSLIKQRSLGGSSGNKTKQSQLLSQNLDHTVKGKVDKQERLNEEKSKRDKEEFQIDESKNDTTEKSRVKVLGIKDSATNSNVNKVEEKSNPLLGNDLPQQQGDGISETEDKKEKSTGSKIKKRPSSNIKQTIKDRQADVDKNKSEDSKNDTIDDKSNENICDKSLDIKKIKATSHMKEDGTEKNIENVNDTKIKAADSDEVEYCLKVKENFDTDIKSNTAHKPKLLHSSGIKSIEIKNETFPKKEENSNIGPPASKLTEKALTKFENKERLPKTNDKSVDISDKPEKRNDKSVDISDKPDKRNDKSVAISDKAEKRNDKADSPDKSSTESTSTSPPSEIILRRKKAPSESEVKRRSDRFSSGSSGGNNRLSTISADSCRLSSESASVEIITSPDSNGASRSLSNSSMTSPSVEIISESKSRSSDSVEVLKSDEDIEEEGLDEMDDSMSESTQTLTTAMNVMLKSSSSLETSFSEMNSSRENISLSRALHLPLSKSSSLSQSQNSAQSVSLSDAPSNPPPSKTDSHHSQAKTVTFTDTKCEDFPEEEIATDVVSTQPCSQNKDKHKVDAQIKTVSLSQPSSQEKDIVPAESSSEQTLAVSKENTDSDSKYGSKTKDAAFIEDSDPNENSEHRSSRSVQGKEIGLSNESTQNSTEPVSQTKHTVSDESVDSLTTQLCINEKDSDVSNENAASTVDTKDIIPNEFTESPSNQTDIQIEESLNESTREKQNILNENDLSLTRENNPTFKEITQSLIQEQDSKESTRENESMSESIQENKSLSESAQENKSLSESAQENKSMSESAQENKSMSESAQENKSMSESAQEKDSIMDTSASTLVASSLIDSNVMNSSASTMDVSASIMDTSGNSTLVASTAMDSSLNVMDGSASTLVGSSDDGTFVHIPRDSSPMSMERCEMIKISSGHTSGDDMDTNTTSSSIEIISSPYGDNSSYGAATSTSRASPSKHPYRPSSSRRGDNELLAGGRGVQTHRRAPSETSSEDTEAERLQKKISEMTEVLEARELKLLTLSKQHSDLNETTSKLKSENDNMSRMNEEFTQRLATLEKQYQQVMTEKENLRRQVEATKLAATRQGLDEDKDEIIAQLRSEGAALSRQQMLLTTSVRKLRAAEKEANKTRDSLRAELDSRTADLERLQKLVQAKEEVERSQIEAVNQLTKTNARLERDVTSLQQQLDTLTSTLIESQKELQIRSAALSDLEHRLETNTSSVEEKLRQELEVDINAEVERREQMERSMEHFRQSMMASEQEYTQRIEKLRQENLAALHRLEEAKLLNEQLTESMISATTPLTQQIETLTSAHAQAAEAWEEEERRLNEKINELNSRLSSLKHIERNVKESSMAMTSKISALESKLESEHRDVLRLREQLQTVNEDIEKLNKEKESALQAKDVQIKSLTHELAECRRCCIGLEQRLSVERAALESEQRRLVSLQDQMQGYQQVSPVAQGTYSSAQTVTDGRENAATPPAYHSHSQGSSPMSLGRPVSVTDSVFPPSEDGDQSHAHSSLNKHVYDSLRLGGTTSLIESLQSQIKLKDTEVQHLTWELSRRDLERTSLTSQLTSLASRVEELESVSRDHVVTQAQYDALLQMYGEKLEECQELRLDLDDVKEMYKGQIDQLLKKDESG